MATIWIINQYASIPPTGTGGRHRHLARELAARGHRVRLIAASWTHGLRDQDQPTTHAKIEEFEGFTFVRLPVPRYRDAHDPRRVVNWFLFTARLAGLRRLLPQDRPDAILVSSPSPVAFLGAEWLARRLGARLVFEVRDIWPLTLIELGGHTPRHPLIRLLRRIERRAYRNADLVISNLPGALDHMRADGVTADRFRWIPNGISAAETTGVTGDPPQLPKPRFLIGYAGTHGHANALDTLLDAATQLSGDPEIGFVLIGQGKDKPALQATAQARGLTNVTFLDPVPRAALGAYLHVCDAFYLGWRRAGIYRFGIAANKLYDYLHAGRPIVHAYDGAHDPVAAHGAGVTCRAEDPVALADAIRRLAAAPDESRAAMGRAGRNAAVDHDYARIALSLEAALVGPILHGDTTPAPLAQEA